MFVGYSNCKEHFVFNRNWLGDVLHQCLCFICLWHTIPKWHVIGLEKEALKIALSYLLWISLSLQIETNVNSVVVTIKPQLVRTPWAVLSASVKMDIGIKLEAAEQSAKVGMNVIFTDKFKRIRCWHLLHLRISMSGKHQLYRSYLLISLISQLMISATK